MSDTEIKIAVARHQGTVSIEVQKGSEAPERFELTYTYAASLRRHLERVCTPHLDQVIVQGGGLVHVEAASVRLGLTTFLPATPEAPDGGVSGPAPWVLSMPVARKLIEALS